MMPEGRTAPTIDETSFPVQRILAIVGDKWSTIVLYYLSVRQVRRFNELQRQIPEISKKMLAQTLRALERDGLLVRTDYAEVPPRTDYRLSADGHKLREAVAMLCEWGLKNSSFVDKLLARRG